MSVLSPVRMGWACFKALFRPQIKSRALIKESKLLPKAKRMSESIEDVNPGLHIHPLDEKMCKKVLNTLTECPLALISLIACRAYEWSSKQYG